MIIIHPIMHKWSTSMPLLPVLVVLAYTLSPIFRTCQSCWCLMILWGNFQYYQYKLNVPFMIVLQAILHLNNLPCSPNKSLMPILWLNGSWLLGPLFQSRDFIGGNTLQVLWRMEYYWFIVLFIYTRLYMVPVVDSGPQTITNLLRSESLTSYNFHILFLNLDFLYKIQYNTTIKYEPYVFLS